MKITANQKLFINIPAGKESSPIIKNINQGDVISASIIRAEGNRAILETGGKYITAEFTGGIPDTKIINLILMEKSADKLIFTVAGNEKSDTIINILSGFSLIPEDEIKTNVLQNLARFINLSRPDLIDINFFLLGLKKDKDTDKKHSVLFMKLQQKGISHQALVDLAYIIYSRYNPVIYRAFKYLLNITGKKTGFLHDEDTASMKKTTDSLCNILNEEDTDFSVMLDLIFDDDKDNMSYGRMAVPDGEKFTDAEFVLHNESVFLKLDLSATGLLEVFVRSDKDSVLINFFTEKEDVLKFLEGSKDILKKMLEQAHVKKSTIGYYNSKKVVEKINLWCVNFYTKSGFNIKV